MGRASTPAPAGAEHEETYHVAPDVVTVGGRKEGLWSVGCWLVVVGAVGAAAAAALLSLAMAQGESGRFLYMSFGETIEGRLLNEDGTPRLIVAPAGLRHLMANIVYGSPAYVETAHDPFYSLYNPDAQGGDPVLSPYLWLSHMLEAIPGGVMSLVENISTSVPYVPPTAPVPPLPSQGCVGSCYTSAVQSAYVAAFVQRLLQYSSIIPQPSAPIEEVLSTLGAYGAPSRPFFQYMYKRSFKRLLQDSQLGQGGHPLAVCLTTRIVGVPFESDYRYPAAYYSGTLDRGVRDCNTADCAASNFRCSPPHVEDAVLAGFLLPPARTEHCRLTPNL